VTSDIVSIITDGVRVESCSSLGRDIIGWRQCKTTGEKLRENVVERQFALANNGISAGDYTALDTTDNENDLQLKKAVEERTLHRLAKAHDFMEVWQWSQNLRATQMESLA